MDKPVASRNDLIEGNAFAGAARVFKDKVLLVNASGQLGSVAYKGVKAEGIEPFEHTTQLVPAKAETVVVGRKLAGLGKPEGRGMLIAVDGTGKSESPDSKSNGLKGWILVQGDKITYAMSEGTVKVTLTAEGRRRIFQMPVR